MTFKVNTETLSEKKAGAHCFNFILNFFTVKMFRRSSERNEDCQKETGEANEGNWGKCESACSPHDSIVRFKPLLYNEKSVQTEAYLMHSAKVSWELYIMKMKAMSPGREHAIPAYDQRAKEEADLGRGFVSVAFIVQKFTDQLMFAGLLQKGALHAGTVAADMFSSENLLVVPVVMSTMRAMASFVD